MDRSSRKNQSPLFRGSPKKKEDIFSEFNNFRNDLRKRFDEKDAQPYNISPQKLQLQSQVVQQSSSQQSLQPKRLFGENRQSLYDRVGTQEKKTSGTLSRNYNISLDVFGKSSAPSKIEQLLSPPSKQPTSTTHEFSKNIFSGSQNKNYGFDQIQEKLSQRTAQSKSTQFLNSPQLFPQNQSNNHHQSTQQQQQSSTQQGSNQTQSNINTIKQLFRPSSSKKEYLSPQNQAWSGFRISPKKYNQAQSVQTQPALGSNTTTSNINQLLEETRQKTAQGVQTFHKSFKEQLKHKQISQILPISRVTEIQDILVDASDQDINTLPTQYIEELVRLSSVIMFRVKQSNYYRKML